GLGLFSRSPLARGTFICEFAGELISDEETSRRWDEYKALGVGNYILCINEGLPESGDGVRTNIDPTRRGNVARFINHLCPPLTNLIILPVRCDSHLSLLPADVPAPPRAAIFAKRDIAADEELGYDYADASGQMQEEGEGDGEGGKGVTEGRERVEGRTTCRCGSVQCRGWLPSAAHRL
ncbi:SET domain-containing protein, partial [Microstroma glucosiphilum]